MNAQVEALVCPPDFYDVDYVINPWMEGNIHRSSRERAAEQWRNLTDILKNYASLQVLEPRPGLPDMVFTANAGLVAGREVVLSHFMHRERQAEEPRFREWFEAHGYKVRTLPRGLPFEGAGDALFDRGHDWLWAAYGQRTELDAHPLIANWLGVEVLSLRLIDKRFYHLDTCFCPLEGGFLLYHPAAFDAYSNHLIEERVPAPRRIAVSEADAVNFACNAVNIGKAVVLNKAGSELKDRLHREGFDVIETPSDEFMKSGGSVKCLMLRLTEPVPRGGARTLVESCVLQLEGHLLDSGLLDRTLDATVNGGGSFQILRFHLGKQRQSTSDVDIKISAPSGELLDKIVSQLIDLGAAPPTEAVDDVEMQLVTLPGVAPDDFYSTTIYPTEVRIHGEWALVADQRMDGVVVIEDGGARCKLLRDLNPGEKVVTGVKGIRTVRKPDARDQRGGVEAAEEFGFMASGVSSERRVELVVEQIAWDLRRIRERHGKIVVVPGPVVIHTGGSGHLAHLIREGYVQALLGGNAIAVHDIEQALYGTSLGVDLKHGVSVRGGHRHHVRAINTIRRCGGIVAAVKQGILTHGVFYECVKKGVPFSLAGSIRDDGPLPETQMDLAKAQAYYARLIKGADMILMLSTMLHSIGVGNMTPAGVKLVCVDINPAVVTKLSDRGSMESTGIVTDVGLFLSLLVQRLEKSDKSDSGASG